MSKRARGLALCALLAVSLGLLAPRALAKDKDAPKDDEPTAAEHVEKGLARMESTLKDGDMDKILSDLRWLGRYHRHKDVLKLLKKLYLKDKDIEIVAAAAEGLKYQTHDRRGACKVLSQGLKKYRKLAGKEVRTEAERLQEELEAKVIVETVKSIGALEDRKVWPDLEKLIDHNNDDVAIATIELAGRWKEYRALPIIKEWFHHYPDGASWSGGVVKVDTGAAGNKDAKAAKAKWMGKYGSRAKKARPNAFKAMIQAVKDITGVEMTKQEELEAWMKENKALLKKHGV